MKFLRTASTKRLLTVIGAIVAVVAASAAVAVAATSGGPVPRREPLAQAIHQALKAPAISGISGRLTYTNDLIDSSEIQGTDPLLQGATGRFWYAPAAHELRLELQSSNGDGQVLVHNQSFWIYDPSSQTVYEGALPAQRGGAAHAARAKAHHQGLPSVAQIQSGINHLSKHVRVGGAAPTDIAGQPAYSLRLAPRQGGGLLSGLGLAWDAVRGVPLQFALYARGDSSPVLELSATNISFGRVAASDFAVSPPAGAKVVHLSSAGNQRRGAPPRAKPHRQQVMGAAAVQRALPFKLAAPAKVGGLSRNTVALVHMGSRPAALVTYGQGLGGVAVLEAVSSGHQGSAFGSSSSQNDDGQGLSVPTVSIDGTTGQELETALGTVISFTRNHVSYTVLGSVQAAEARAVARGL